MKTTRASGFAALAFFVCTIAGASPVKAGEGSAGGFLVALVIIFCGPPLALLMLGLLAVGSRRSASRVQHTVGIVSGSILALALLALAAIDLHRYLVMRSRYDSVAFSVFWVVTGALAILIAVATYWSAKPSKTFALETSADRKDQS